MSEEFPLGHAKLPEVLYLTPGSKHHCIYQSFATCPRIRTTIVLIVAHTSPINSCGWKVILSTPTWAIHLDQPDIFLGWISRDIPMSHWIGWRLAGKCKKPWVSPNISGFPANCPVKSCKPIIRCFVWQIPPTSPHKIQIYL